MTPFKTIADNLIEALSIMDERGRKNKGNNSYLLWKKEWEELRSYIYTAWEEFKKCEIDSGYGNQD